MISLAFKDSAGATQTIVLDAVVTETHDGRVAITDHPVEKGANPSDHVRVLPKGLKLTAIFTDFPLPSSPSAGYVGRADNLLQWLWDLRDAATVFVVTTTPRVYRDMLIEGISEPRDKDIIAGERFSIELKEVRFVSTQTVAVTKPKKASGQAKKDEGPKVTKPAKEAQAQTALKHLKDAVSGGLSFLAGG
jgi:hypothetical protein